MALSPDPPGPVSRPVMHQRWETITFLHWPYPVDVVRDLVPSELQIDTCEGSAWVSLTPFQLSNLHPPSLPALPWISGFPETNLRTYVRGPGGEPGIWFFSLDCDRLAAVIAARVTYGLPYEWADMAVLRQQGGVTYRSKRYDDSGAVTEVSVAPGEALDSSTLDDLHHFLTARYRLYSRLAKRLLYAAVEHVRWPLQAAEVTRLTETLTARAGLPKPDSTPLCHHSAGVDVRVAAPVFYD